MMENNKALEYYMSDPDIAGEPAPLREVHAIRLMIYDETKGMTSEERMACARREALEVMEEFGLTHLMVS